MAKKYFWLKLKEDFFQQKTIKKLRKIAGGDTYTIIYLKLQLLSIREEGKLYFEGIEENFEEEMALALDEEVDNIKITLLYLKNNDLIEIVSKYEYFLPEVFNSLGSESDTAERMRQYRARKEEKKKQERNKVTLDCNSVTPLLQPVTKCYTEIEIEQDKDIDKELNNSLSNITNIDRPKTNLVLKQELSLIIGDLKLNINELIKLNKPVTRIKDVIEWCKANGKGEGYMFKAIKNDWNLREPQAVSNDKKTNIKKTKTQENLDLINAMIEKEEKNGKS